MTNSAPFHKLAKEAGNRLSLAARQDSALRQAQWPRIWMTAALALAALTASAA